MKKRNISLIQWFATAFFVFLIGLTMTSPAKADQANLSDGTYTVPVTLLKAGSSSTSIANSFFTQTANVKVTGGTYQIQLQTSGADYITSVTVGGQPVHEEDKSGSNANLTVNLTNPSDLVPVTFGLQVPGLGTMNQSAQFQFKWSSATRTQGSTPEAATSSNATATPATPVNPSQPTTPTKPVNPSQPTTPTKPVNPSQPKHQLAVKTAKAQLAKTKAQIAKYQKALKKAKTTKAKTQARKNLKKAETSFSKAELNLALLNNNKAVKAAQTKVNKAKAQVTKYQKALKKAKTTKAKTQARKNLKKANSSLTKAQKALTKVIKTNIK
ncbi:NEAT domain-containing protein [Secundilactobacillus hailunensis]|uniref:NEAT domain-containing protein n=1 Tax=Secundilactobacillus hailunensis TaxID=2559923 RepID=A0ABW1T560_9LACO|nr:NEAT domain-containing protein [Secundilactobacillus hailunensis]